jgi:hypothetical protein
MAEVARSDASKMAEVARSEVHTKARPYPQHYRWGIVDVILAVLMLPFGIWMLVIEKMVGAVAAFGRR